MKYLFDQMVSGRIAVFTIPDQLLKLIFFMNKRGYENRQKKWTSKTISILVIIILLVSTYCNNTGLNDTNEISFYTQGFCRFLSRSMINVCVKARVKIDFLVFRNWKANNKHLSCSHGEGYFDSWSESFVQTNIVYHEWDC